MTMELLGEPNSQQSLLAMKDSASYTAPLFNDMCGVTRCEHFCEQDRTTHGWYLVHLSTACAQGFLRARLNLVHETSCILRPDQNRRCCQPGFLKNPWDCPGIEPGPAV